MPIGGMGGGQGFGLAAKVEAQVDKQSQRQLTRDVESAIEQAEQSVSPQATGGFQGRTMPGGGARGGAGATAAGAGGAGLLSKLGGTTKMLGTVALGGAVAVGMLKRMGAASGHLKATSSILGTAVDLFFKPFGDYLGRTLRPMSKALLEMSIGLNKNISENGLVIGGMQSLLDFVNNLPGELGKVIVRTWGSALESLFGENRFFTAMQNFRWSDWIPIVKWDDVLGGAFDVVRSEWPGWPDLGSLDVDVLDDLVSTTASVTDAFQGLIQWISSTIPGVDLTGDGNGGGGGGGDGTDGTDQGEFRDPAHVESDPRTSTGSRPGGITRGSQGPAQTGEPMSIGPAMEGVDLRRIGGDPAGRQTSVELNLNDERVGKLTVREQANLLRRL